VREEEANLIETIQFLDNAERTPTSYGRLTAVSKR